MVTTSGQGAVWLGMARHGAVSQGLAWRGEGGSGLRARPSISRG